MSDIIFAAMYGAGNNEEVRDHGCELCCIEIDFTPESLNAKFNHKGNRIDFRAYRPSTSLHITEGIAARTLPWRRKEMLPMPRIERFAYENLVERVHSVIQMDRDSGLNVDLVVVGHPAMITSKKESMTAPPQTPQEALKKMFVREDEHYTAHIKLSYMGFELRKKPTGENLFVLRQPIHQELEPKILEIGEVEGLAVDPAKGVWSYGDFKDVPIGEGKNLERSSVDVTYFAVYDRNNIEHIRGLSRRLKAF
ncbi:MAG: hypothetical protein KAT43_02560 [Nanoarchaeota archaeon]|nr:hypothetical protein [Nanoarchaeota archaeon]